MFNYFVKICISSISSDWINVLFPSSLMQFQDVYAILIQFIACSIFSCLCSITILLLFFHLNVQQQKVQDALWSSQKKVQWIPLNKMLLCICEQFSRKNPITIQKFTVLMHMVFELIKSWSNHIPLFVYFMQNVYLDWK